MDYWEAVLKEVLNKDNPDYPSYFTCVRQRGEHVRTNNRVPRARRARTPEKSAARKFYVQDNSQGPVYFTYREAQTIWHALRGHSVKTTAVKMGLSPRTVEFYMKNMRLKIELKSKQALLAWARALGLDEKLPFSECE